MKRLAIILIILFSAKSVFAADLKYKADEIAQNLKLSSKAIVRDESVEFEVLSPKEALKRVRFAVTVMNNNGLELSRFIQYYDNYSEIGQLKAVIYDESGKVVKKYSGSDYKDYSYISGFSLFESGRVKYLDPEYRKYPFTIEFTYEIKYKGIINYPQWTPFSGYNVAVEKSQLKVITPANFKLRYQQKNIDSNMPVVEKQQKTSYLWSFSKIPSILYEEKSLPSSKFLPTVYLAPVNFEIEGFAGNMESWKGFGEWIQNLNNGTETLDLQKSEFVKNLVKDAKTDIEKITILYNYLQNTTRYVSVQLGIGSWRPIQAETVSRVGYGDCKALTTYMKSMLGTAGIKSYYTLIKAGEDADTIDTTFPSNQFNHAILFVPLEKDTIWLENTSQHIPAGYLGSFTDDRYALVIKDSGSELVKTPGLADNSVSVSSVITLDNTSATAKINIDYTGLYYDRMSSVLYSEESEKKKAIENSFSIPHLTINNYSMEASGGPDPKVMLKSEVNIANYSTRIKDRIIFPLNLLSDFSNSLPLNDSRKNAIYFQRHTNSSGTTEFIIPPGFKADKLPEKTEIKSQFGEYYSEVKAENNRLIYTRKFSMYKGTYPADQYNLLLQFYESVEKADNTKIVLKQL